MDSARGFTANYFDDARMGVPQGIDRDTAKKIEILFSVRIVNVAALSSLQQKWLSFVRR